MIPANVLVLGFQEGYFDRSDVARWVDERIAECDRVPDTLLALLPMSALDESELSVSLRALAAPMSPEESARLRVDLVCDSFRRGRSDLRTTALRLEHLTWSEYEHLPRELLDAAGGLDDAFLLADGGQYGTVEEAEARVREFVAEFGRPVG